MFHNNVKLPKNMNMPPRTLVSNNLDLNHHNITHTKRRSQQQGHAPESNMEFWQLPCLST